MKVKFGIFSASDMEVDHEMETDRYKLDAHQVQQIHDLYKVVEDKSIPVSSIAECKELLKLEECLLKYKELLAENSRIAKLWLQYMKLFIQAERTGNWTLHLVAVGRMMNLFAATGHIYYARSSHLYLQQMLDLSNDHPWLYQCFVEHGFYTVHRSSTYLAVNRL